MAKKVFIGVGHGGTDPGAVKYITEKEYTLKTAKAVSEYLKEYGIEYKLSRTADIDTDMDSKVKMCNNYNPDLVIDIHFNAGGGTGFEVYHSVVGGTSKTLAENINANVKKIFTSRGIKTKKLDNGRDYFAIIRDTKAPAVLCEGGFVDTKSDADFVKENYKKLAKAYADGIAKTLGITAKKEATSNKDIVEKLYRVRTAWDKPESQIGAYKNLDGAKKACQSGYTVYDWDGKAVYKKPAESKYIDYTVKSGDTLWDIAHKYLRNGSRYKEIMFASGITSETIYVGQKLTIPKY